MITGRPDLRWRGIKSRRFQNASKFRPQLTPSEDWIESGLFQNAFYDFAIVSLDLDATIFYRATDAARFLNFLGQLFDLRHPNSFEARYHGDRLAAPMSRFANDIKTPASGVFPIATRRWRRSLFRNDTIKIIRSLDLFSGGRIGFLLVAHLK